MRAKGFDPPGVVVWWVSCAWFVSALACLVESRSNISDDFDKKRVLLKPAHRDARGAVERCAVEDGGGAGDHDYYFHGHHCSELCRTDCKTLMIRPNMINP